MKCELCPIQDYCPALKDHKKDCHGNYHPEPTRIPSYDAPDCPLWMLAIEGRNPRTKKFLADTEGTE